MWEIEAAISGWARSQGGDGKDQISTEEADDLWQGIMDRMG